MIAPLRETDESVDANAQLLARARRAVAVALLNAPRKTGAQTQIAAGRAWLFAIWTALIAVSSIGLFFGWWRVVPY